MIFDCIIFRNRGVRESSSRTQLWAVCLHVYPKLGRQFFFPSQKGTEWKLSQPFNLLSLIPLCFKLVLIYLGKGKCNSYKPIL